MLDLFASLFYLSIAKGADVNAHKTGALGIPLHCAAWHGHYDVAKELISSGSDINALSWDSRSPLHYAAGNQHVNVSELLITSGANINQRNKDGYTPLQYFKDQSTESRLLKLANSNPTSSSSSTSNTSTSTKGGGEFITKPLPINGLILSPRSDNCIDRVQYVGERSSIIYINNNTNEEMMIHYGAVYYNSHYRQWMGSDRGLGEIKPGTSKGICLNRSVGGDNVKWFAVVFTKKNWFNCNVIEFHKCTPIQKDVEVAARKAIKSVAIQWRDAWVDGTIADMDKNIESLSRQM
ncbi:hypothetical protein DFA_00594 [Cavenderia fasciculata]|uniref:Ankyrin repeat-containing protein n=1 Tax=Cavenderia fasciculata TaxID=261658 RepID=F4PSN9_CACFS|nr:uncharacterized protein DFA_00594 [Cavenderia fasciculata]EGG20731.1 hypothetical protein DFA_00594 [Cavenderia fasciculata]|eukprot:XP_004358581.1 hypothetical protein DFA_00594 [Cavenderia fasciculata]